MKTTTTSQELGFWEVEDTCISEFGEALVGIKAALANYLLYQLNRNSH
jgi:hypothetical protein